eukprot:1910785-Prymnesium_polylepis.1
MEFAKAVFSCESLTTVSEMQIRDDRSSEMSGSELDANRTELVVKDREERPEALRAEETEETEETEALRSEMDPQVTETNQPPFQVDVEALTSAMGREAAGLYLGLGMEDTMWKQNLRQEALRSEIETKMCAEARSEDGKILERDQLRQLFLADVRVEASSVACCMMGTTSKRTTSRLSCERVLQKPLARSRSMAMVHLSPRRKHSACAMHACAALRIGTHSLLPGVPAIRKVAGCQYRLCWLTFGTLFPTMLDRLADIASNVQSRLDELNA